MARKSGQRRKLIFDESGNLIRKEHLDDRGFIVGEDVQQT